MTIYMTTYDPETMQCTAASVDTGLSTLEQAEQMFGAERIHRRVCRGPGVVYSDFIFHVDTPVNSGYSPAYQLKQVKP